VRGGESTSDAGSRCRVIMAPPLVVASLRYLGPARDVGSAFDELVSWGQVYQVERWGPLIGVYADRPPEGTDELAAEVWFPIPPGLREMDTRNDQILIRAVEQTEVATHLHSGFPDELGESMAVLLQWVQDQGLARASADHRQVYLEAPPGRPAEWRVEIQVPVRRP
jgi:DNA gyrase inhibitor GyrI